MARYTGLFIVAVPIDRLRQLLIDVLESCSCEIIYDTGDYIMAREVPGQISYTKLVKVEVLIDRPNGENDEIRMNFVTKNEELPLHADNHCRQMFNQIQQAIERNRQWHVVESTIS
ncbi:hypothetical protein [Microcoleus sp. FACHB-68]|uniref:hypothetical protein n=1 Tax=Microcoleus sp. FACHB-68 TaxID=2692826 RepID=UPI001687CDE6|nr:hypothetical protein [Microcoleus sp. FACHB-68]MBD1937833.1 hypothetical protein [Microcoleus sp. FACHB-68]